MNYAKWLYELTAEEAISLSSVLHVMLIEEIRVHWEKCVIMHQLDILQIRYLSNFFSISRLHRHRFANFPFPYNISRLLFFSYSRLNFEILTLGLHVGGQLIREPVNHLIKSCPTVQRDHVSNVGSQLTFVYFFVDFKIIDSGHVSVHTYVLASCGISPSSVSISTPDRQRMEITKYFLNTLYSGHFYQLKKFQWESLIYTINLLRCLPYRHKKKLFYPPTKLYII